MHRYATNTPVTAGKLWHVFVLAALISSVLGVAIGKINHLAGWALAGPSGIAVFEFLWWLFDSRLWRCAILRRYLLVPDLNGEWAIVGQTITKNGERVDYPSWSGTLTIVQSWSTIRIILRVKQSGSASCAASLHHEEGIGYRLMYAYENDPLPAETELKRHRGFANLTFNETVTGADGYYFTDKDRATYGSMKLIKGKDGQHGQTAAA